MNPTFLKKEFTDNPLRITALVEGLTLDQARYKPNPDSWSVLEVINHMADVEIQDFRSHLDFILAPEGKEGS
jgi:hypothetical protein